jgi:hypothetical protein
MRQILIGLLVSGLGIPSLLADAQTSRVFDVLKPVGGLPAHIAGRFQDPIGFAQTESGEYLVLDRRAHTVYAVDPARRNVREVIQIGFEQGRELGAGVLSVGEDDIFAVADAPNGLERIQYFSLTGMLIGGFYLEQLRGPRLSFGPVVLNGIGSMAFTGRTFLLNRPGQGALFSEYGLNGHVTRQIGSLRPTGQEDDGAVHQALNVGLPLVDPTGGYYFVFQTGRPMFQKYTADGRLVFERHIEGPELDQSIVNLPTTWRAREDEPGVQPLVEPLVRAAAVDPKGRLWVSLMAPVTYVYDPLGEKIRTVVFDAPGLDSPSSLFFTPDGRLLVTPGCYEFSVD